ncbi:MULTISPECIES: protein kinase [Arthrobacter]|uniref:non-specific serine/threonine protein kinase n=1 Tax=Arthrobacter terricola TaxID=2547396 RepID=A0A4R5KC98_9MICC|nr:MULTISPECIES: protein kinase [Arthrobacter]MBT8162583.1 protein kinase [Arthrobacter sp. GN70]TDF92861.1 PASTA domain-containing protein [Arthrobacter terricola]
MSRPLGSRYTITESLGRGAMGEVFAAEDVDGRDLAVKVLHPDLAQDQSVVSRFVQERGILVSLADPHLVHVEDLVVEGETLAIVMERIHGPNLATYLAGQGTLPPAEVCRLGAGIATGLAAVHAAGVVHRDVKPENVLLDTTGSETSPKVTDFGVSVLTDSQRTRSTMLVGTPEYIAPELANGSEPSPAADLYSLGVMLYKLCCGVTPFAGGSLIAVLKRAAELPPGRPGGIPDELWDLIHWLLSKRPEQRPDSAHSLAFQLTALAQTLDGPAAPVLSEPPPAPGPSVTETPTQFSGLAAPTVVEPNLNKTGNEANSSGPGRKSRKALILGAAVAVVALVLAGVLATTLLRPTATNASSATTTSAVNDSPSPSLSATPTATISSTPSATSSASVSATAAPGTVPNLVGKLLPDAQRLLGTSTRLQVTDKFDPSSPDGTVLTQDPQPGTDLSTLGIMKVTVSRSAITTYLADQSAVNGSMSSGSANISGVAYPHSLSATFCDYSPEGASVEYNLGRNYQTFAATAGVSDDSQSNSSTVLVEVFADGRKVSSQTVSYGQAFPINVDMTNVLRLKIQWQGATCGKDGRASLVVGDARILGAPGVVPMPTSTQ